jgi:hypothetical protein
VASSIISNHGIDAQNSSARVRSWAGRRILLGCPLEAERINRQAPRSRTCNTKHKLAEVGGGARFIFIAIRNTKGSEKGDLAGSRRGGKQSPTRANASWNFVSAIAWASSGACGSARDPENPPKMASLFCLFVCLFFLFFFVFFVGIFVRDEHSDVAMDDGAIPPLVIVGPAITWL